MAVTPMRPLILTLALALLAGCQDKTEPVANTPLPIIENNQLRYPAGHPQLRLLETAVAVQAQSVAVDLPARLVWDEEKTQRIFPAFAGRVTRITADVGQPVSPGQVLAQLASPDFGAAQADTSRAQAEATLARKALALTGPLVWRRFNPQTGATMDVAANPLRWGDPVIARKGLPTSYHLSVVIDDAGNVRAIPMRTTRALEKGASQDTGQYHAQVRQELYKAGLAP